MLDKRGLGLAEVTRHGRDGALDKAGNDKADDAADFGRRRVPVRGVDSGRHFAGPCNRWYPVVSANEDGAGRGERTAVDPCVWSAGAVPKERRLRWG